MQAVVFREFGDPSVLQTDEVAVPAMGAADVLIRVAAVSVGRLLDLTARAGTHPYARFQLPHILGAEHAGTVVAVGSGVDTVTVGDRVAVFPVVSCAACAACLDGCPEACPELEIMGVHRPGAYAQYTRVPAVTVHAVPDGIDPVTAAGLALAGPVAQNQLTQAGLRPGDWVLVQGAASALGSLTAALARHLGARVIGTSRCDRKRQRLLELGVAAALDPTSDDFVDQVLELTGGAGARIVIDDLGEEAIWDRSLAALATRGTAVSSGAFLGGKVGLDLLRLYSRCQQIVGVRTGNPASARRLWAEVANGFRPVIDRTFPVARAADAHRYLEASTNMGRVVLTAGSGHDWRPDR
ncbi:MAG: zinc-binding dehydrogenase [Pseudonocardiaceae bacterium]|nr:zinc-binding dehydrogenase [Pseudonocardiaceae bacterium]